VSATLQGRRVLLTRSREDNRAWSQDLAERGLAPVALACVATETRPEAAPELSRELAACDWLVVCSRRAVQAVKELHPAALPARVRVACVGPATAVEANLTFGRAEKLAPLGTGRSLGAELAATLPRSARVLVAAALEGRVDVEDVLRPAGVDVHRVAVYRTRPVRRDGPPLLLDALALDAVFLASPSAVRGLLNQALPPSRAAFVTLGPSTTEGARAAGLTVHAEARERSLDGLLAALQQHLESAESHHDQGRK